jgi:phospholipid/cholesterol/gamma-HCH transport system substrate-binding protein
MSMNRSTILGLFFLVTLSVLAYYTLFLTDFTLFKKQPHVHAQFEQANGLREGDAVLVAGMRWGRVKKMSYDPTAPIDKRVTVDAVLNDPLQLREGFTIKIKDSTLLGGHVLAIDPGPADGAPVSSDQMLSGTVARNPIDALSQIIDTSGPGVQTAIENFKEFSANLNDGKGVLNSLVNDPGMAQDLSDSLASLAQTTADVKVITANLRAGRGTAGQFLNNDELYQSVSTASVKISALTDELTGLVKEVRAGNGLVGELIQDQTMANDAKATLAAARSTMQKIDSGQGTIGALVNDDALARRIQVTADNLANGKGTIGALLTNSAVYDNVRQATENIAVFSDALRSGQGTIGRLVLDDDLYQDIKTAMRIVQRSLEEFREAAPITTFTTVFFGAF